MHSKWGLGIHGFVRKWFPDWGLWDSTRHNRIVCYRGGTWAKLFLFALCVLIAANFLARGLRITMGSYVVPQTELASEGVLADLVTMFLGSLRLGRPTPPWATGGHRRPRPAAPPPPSGSRSPQPGVRKTWFCLGNGSKIGMRGNPATQMDCMVPRMCLDVPVSPQTAPDPSFWVISQFSGILGRAPGHPLPICLLYTSPSPRDKRQSRMPSSA